MAGFEFCDNVPAASVQFHCLYAGRRRTRVYYHLEPAGEEYLKQVRKEYFGVTKGVLNVLRKCGEGLAEDERL